MADPTPEVWNWLDSIWGFGAGVVTGVLAMVGWVNPKFKVVHQRIDEVSEQMKDAARHAHEENDDLSSEIHNRINGTEKLMVELGTQHKAHIELYRGLQDGLRALSEKTDEQTAVLNQVVGELKGMHQGRE